MKTLLVILCLLSSPVWAVQPSEILDDPALEARARELSKGLRCLVCRNENIDDSNAGLARDLRLLVRERLTEGDSDQATVQYIVDRYGEFVLLKPSFSASNLILWLTGPLLLLLGAFFAYTFIRRKPAAIPDSGLSDTEQKQLDDLLKK